MSQEERRSVVVPVVTRGRRESGEECRFGGGGGVCWHDTIVELVYGLGRGINGCEGACD